MVGTPVKTALHHIVLVKGVTESGRGEIDRKRSERKSSII